jgi:hypothetical protein
LDPARADRGGVCGGGSGDGMSDYHEVRKALAKAGFDDLEIADILPIIRHFLRTPGTKEICPECGTGVFGQCFDSDCPIKRGSKE